MTGGGGWPMSVWLTPDLKPFVGATYFPPEDQVGGRPGFRTILNHISKQVCFQKQIVLHLRYDWARLGIFIAYEFEAKWQASQKD